MKKYCSEGNSLCPLPDKNIRTAFIKQSIYSIISIKSSVEWFPITSEQTISKTNLWFILDLPEIFKRFVNLFQDINPIVNLSQDLFINCKLFLGRDKLSLCFDVDTLTLIYAELRFHSQ